MFIIAHQVGMGAGGIKLTSLNTDGVLQSVLTILKANTATIAMSLTSASQINMIQDGDPSVAIPVTIDQYPAIIVKLARETENFSQLGLNKKHLYELEFEIFPMIYLGSGPAESDQDIRIMTKNICKVLKDNLTLSNTAIGSIPENVNYEPDLDGVYCSVSQINFRSQHLNI